MVTTELAQRTAELDAYSSRITQVLADPELKPELERAESYDIRTTIGAVARSLCIIGEEDRALELADELLTTTGSGEYIAKGVYGELVAVGSGKAIDIYRGLIEANKDKIGDEGSEYNIYRYCDDLIDLYKAGDEAAGAIARELIVEAGDDELEAFGARAVRLFQAGDESAFPLLLDTVDKAIAHHYAKDSEVSELDRLMAAADRGRNVPGDDVIGSLSIRLKIFAEDLIKKDDLERAEQIQSRLPKELDRVLLDILKIAEGLDETGRYQERIDKLLESEAKIFFGDRDVDAAFEVFKTAALGGNPKAITELETLLSQELQEQDVTSYGIEAAVVLWKSGKMSEEEFNKVLDLDDSTTHKREVLEELGRTEEARQLARDEFAHNPYSDTAAYALLRYEYNVEAMDLVQNHVGRYESGVVSIMSRRAKWLNVLAKHIQQLQAAQLQPEVQ